MARFIFLSCSRNVYAGVLGKDKQTAGVVREDYIAKFDDEVPEPGRMQHRGNREGRGAGGRRDSCRS